MPDLYPRFAPFFPIGDGLVRLEVVPAEGPASAADESGRLIVRLVVFEELDGRASIRDIKEQELHLGPVSLYRDTGRVDEMLYAQREVLQEVLRGPVSRLGTLMPYELVFGDVLRLARARTREDFAKALRARSRLGKYLAG